MGTSSPPAGVPALPVILRSLRAVLLAAVVAALSLSIAPVAPGATPRAAAAPSTDSVPKASCGPGSHPETGLQGRVSLDDINGGRAAEGYRCNTELVGSELTSVPLGSFGGFKVRRYVDAAGHECAYYDVQLLVGTGITDVSKGLNAGVAVLDMSNPAKPVRTATLSTVTMLTPHESLQVNQKRGLLAAVAGTPAFGPGVVDVYDISKDCRHPELKSPPLNLAGIIGHESGMALDGNTFYSGNPVPNGQVAAVDVSNPAAPTTLAVVNHPSHGISLSQDGNRAYLTSLFPATLTISDTSQVQSRQPNPQVTPVGSVTWDGTIPQIAIPVTIGGHPYVVEVDEYGALGPRSFIGSKPGAARIIDIADETKPAVISNIRLEVHQPENFAALANDPGAANPVGGYAGHYCNVPRYADPGIMACSMLSSGLRIFNIRDPYHPREIAYFNQPSTITPNFGNTPLEQLATNAIPPSWAQSSPEFVPARCEVWYSDGRTGFYNVRLTNGTCAVMGGGPSEPPTTTPTPAASPVARHTSDDSDSDSDSDGGRGHHGRHHRSGDIVPLSIPSGR
ncbi:MAG: LVIVD repeat-containing protein [Aeromicrobium sp.]